MTQPPITVRLDPRRLDQLKILAAALGTSNAGAIGHLLNEKIAAGIIPDVIPGIVVRKVDAGVSIGIDDNEPAVYSRESARELIRAIRAVVGGAPGEININHRFAMLRKGTGFKLVLPFPGPETAFPGDLALDLARLIEKECA